MSRKKIRIFDDEKGFREALKEKVKGVKLDEEVFDVDMLDREFTDALEGLTQRQKAFRDRGQWDHDGSNPLDDVEVLILDYDLFTAQPFMTADRVAYLARCFSTCGVIVVLNRFGHNPFDLTLKDHPESFADLDIGQQQLDNPFLWGVGREEFAPWYWPALPQLAEDYKQRVQDVEQGLEVGKTIWDLLGFSQQVAERLPLELTRFIDPTGEDCRLSHFVTSNEFGLENKDRLNAVKGDKVEDPKTIARIAAARVGKWLEYVVLPELDILMDAPHLIARLPGLMGDARDIESWNEVPVKHLRDAKSIPNMDTAVIEEFRFKQSHWLSRPVWFWREIIANADITDVRTPWKVERPDFVFCEDSSSYYPREQCHEFQAQTRVSPFSDRYIRRFAGVDYIPLTRLAM